MLDALIVYSAFVTLAVLLIVWVFASCKALEHRRNVETRALRRKSKVEREELSTALARMVAAFDALMPGAKYIAIQDYEELNAAPIAARKLLQREYDKMVSEDIGEPSEDAP